MYYERIVSQHFCEVKISNNQFTVLYYYVMLFDIKYNDHTNDTEHIYPSSAQTTIQLTRSIQDTSTTNQLSLLA